MISTDACAAENGSIMTNGKQTADEST